MAKRGLNKVIIIGNLGNDPEIKAMPNGASVTNITVATSEEWKDKNTGQQQKRTEWHKIVFFNRLAEIAAQYLRKGSKVYLEGSLRTRKWQTQNGEDRYTTEIVANEMQMLDSRQDGQQQNHGQPGQNYQNQNQQYNQQQNANYQQQNQQQGQQQNMNYGNNAPPQNNRQNPNQTQQSYTAPPQNFDDFDDDIPF